MKINAKFDSGAIIVNEIVENADKQLAKLNIAYDAPHAGKPYLQWFHFRAYELDTAKNCSFHIENAGSTTYPEGWINYNVCASYDRKNWFRIKSTYDKNDGILKWEFQPKFSSIFFAYYPPYSQETYLDFISECQMTPSNRCRLDALPGETLDGNTLDVLLVGNPPPLSLNSSNDNNKKKKLKFWVIARQHPGETQASWWMEGFIRRLLDSSDAIANVLLSNIDFYIVPNMNPDGSQRGYLRVNAAGKNLNREWDKSTEDKSPEVFYCQKAIKQTGIDFLLDVHSEEELEYVFLSKTPLGIPSITDKQVELYHKYCSALMQSNPEFQTEFGYKMPEKGQSNLGICCAWAAETYGCLAMTQEQPFKDNCIFPEPNQEWSIARCEKLGASVLDAMYSVMDDLKVYRGKM